MKTIHIPQHLLFTGEIPGEAKNTALDQLEAAENTLSDWQIRRLGKITASEFPNIKYLKGSTKWGETALSYLYDLVGEHLTGEPSQTFSGNRATEWGHHYERDALAAYKKRTKKKVQPQVFYPHPTLAWVGGTPDGPVGMNGLVEAKCPLNFKNHIRTVITRKVPAEYIDQVLGQLWLSGREWADFISYDPRIKGPHGLAIVRVDRVEYEGQIAELAERIEAFHDLLLETLQCLGVKPGANIPKL